MLDIVGKLQELGIELILAEIKEPGYYLPSCKALIVNNTLDEVALKEVILHELKHVMDHSDYNDLYANSFVYHSKMEHEANFFVMDELIKENDGLFNFTGLIENYNVGMGYDSLIAAKAK